MRITKEMVMELKPCYTEKQIDKLAKGRSWVKPSTVAKLDIPLNDRLWLLNKLMPHEQQREFARRCAMDVIHRWDAPDIVREYIETGNEELRDAASAVASDAARAAASDAARAAASDAAWSAASAAASAAARVAASAVASAAARVAASAVASAAASAAASTAAWSAASAAASTAARVAARVAAMEKYIEWCVEYLEAA